MENIAWYTIFASAVSGAISAWVVSVINLAILDKTHKEQRRQKKLENKRIDNLEIARLISEIKASIAKVGHKSQDMIYTKLYYMKEHYGNQIRFDEQDKDGGLLAGGQLSEQEAGETRMRIENRVGKITRATEVIKEYRGLYTKAFLDLNDELYSIIRNLGNLSVLTKSDFSECEEKVLNFINLDYEFVDFDGIRGALSSVKTIPDMNAFNLPANLEPKEKIKLAIQDNLGWVSKHLTEKTYYQ